jgi:hypothetical protein
MMTMNDATLIELSQVEPEAFGEIFDRILFVSSPHLDGILGATPRAVVDRRGCVEFVWGPGVTSPKSRPFRV